jgi:transcriptional regulator with XRE-family HTH domain
MTSSTRLQNIVNELTTHHTREEAGLNQRQVSEDLGFSHPFLLKCETGDRRIDVIELLQLAKLYGKAPSYFLED